MSVCSGGSVVHAEREVVVVGEGRNGLVAACYLGRTGLAVTVLEAAEVAGGGSRTEETIPGFRSDTHNIINMMSIPEELVLSRAGLRYVEIDPFALGIAPGPAPLRFFRSIEATLAALAKDDAAESARYGAWMDWANHLVYGTVSGISPRALLGAPSS